MIKAMREIVEESVRRRWSFQPGRYGIIPLAHRHTPGAALRPLVFPAIIDGAVPMIGKYCGLLAEEHRYGTLNWYSWRAIWTQEHSASPYVQPAYHHRNVLPGDPLFDCFSTDNPLVPGQGWPTFWDLGGGANPFYGWNAINTAQMEYRLPYFRGAYGGVPPYDSVTTAVRKIEVLMSVGVWMAEQWHNDDYLAGLPAGSVPRHNVIVPFFHAYGQPQTYRC